MCMWQSQAFAGALSLGASLPLELGTACWENAGLMPDAITAPAQPRNVRRLIASIRPSRYFFAPAPAAGCRSFVAVHRRIRLGVAHEQIDHERDADHASQIIIVPVLMAERLEPERNR